MAYQMTFHGLQEHSFQVNQLFNITWSKLYIANISSCHICRISTPGALILNHLQEAKTTVKSWSITTDSKFNAISCYNVAVLHLNTVKLQWKWDTGVHFTSICHIQSNVEITVKEL